MQPGRKARFAAKCPDFSKELQERLLRQVLGFRLISGHAKANAVDAPRVRLVEVLEGGGIATLS